LAAFAITPTMLEDLKSRIVAFEEALKDVSTGMAERVGTRSKLSELSVHMDEVLKEEIDPMMQVFRVTDPEFYNEYRSARVIKKPRRTTREARTAFDNGDTGLSELNGRAVRSF
jgi:hypothetical protein